MIAAVLPITTDPPDPADLGPIPPEAAEMIAAIPTRQAAKL